MKVYEWLDFMATIDYKRGWNIEIQEDMRLFEDITNRSDLDPQMFQVRITALVECAYKRNGDTSRVLQSRHVSLAEIKQTDQEYWCVWVRDFFTMIERHEVAEWLLIGGERVFDPHQKEGEI